MIQIYPIQKVTLFIPFFFNRTMVRHGSLTTLVEKKNITTRPVIAGLTRNPLKTKGMLKQVQHDM